MATQIFVNLPVNDLEKSKAFFGKLGFSIPISRTARPPAWSLATASRSCF
jgi:predicted lactoylglutathione lyase